MNKVIPLLAFSILLLVPVGAQNAFAGLGCNTAQTPLVDLLGGECIIAGDKQFDNWELLVQLGNYDLANVQVIPINDDPNNPGLRFLTPGLAKVINSGSREATFINYDVTSLSGDLIKDFSLELIDGSGNVVEIEEFLNLVEFSCTTVTCPDNVKVINRPNALFDEHEFTPSASISVQMRFQAGSNNDQGELEEFVALYSQISPPPTTPPVGGEIIPIETTALILAGAQTFSWMIPVIVSAIGIGIVIARKF